MIIANNKPLAPILIFAYNRPDHLKRLIESLLLCDEAKYSDVFFYSDAPKHQIHLQSVMDVRDYLATVKGFKSIRIINRNINFGLANSILDGVTSVINFSKKVIVLEDDMVVSKYFLRYMNDGLDKYENNERVASIHGYVYPSDRALPESFFMRGADCWGWATWSRVWEAFNPDGLALLTQIIKNKLTKKFDFGGYAAYTKMLKDQIDGKNDSWAIRWHAAMFLAEKYTLYPGQSLVANMGNDSSGTHCGTTERFNAYLSRYPVVLKDIPIVHSSLGEAAFKLFFSKSFPWYKKYALSFTSQDIVMTTKKMLRDFLPPFLFKIKKMVHSFANPIFSNKGVTWEAAVQNSSGYVKSEILNKVYSATSRVKHYWGAYDRDSVVFEEEDYCWPLLSSLLWAASLANGSLRVLDYGGALGSTLYQNRRFLESLPELNWAVVEQGHFVALGNQEFKSKKLNFYENIKTATRSIQPNLILLSSVLQYLQNPYEVLSELMAVGAEFIIIDRVIINSTGEDFVSIQKVPSSIYKASYPCNSLSESRLMQHLNKEYYLELIIPTLAFEELSQIDSEFKGYIFRKRFSEEIN